VPVVPGQVRFVPEGPAKGVQGFVARLPDGRCVVSFRGSLTLNNWYADFYAFQRPWPPADSDRGNATWCQGCLAHSGFAAAYEELRGPVHAALLDLSCGRVAVTGHSLGAAVATLAAFDLRAARGLRVERVWTFGKPRIGNAAFVGAFVAAAERQGQRPALWRVVHYHDPVPRAPPDLPGYYEVSHAPEEVYYTDRESTDYIVCPQEGSMENRSAECSAGFPLALCFDTDHLYYLNVTMAYKYAPAECKLEGTEAKLLLVV